LLRARMGMQLAEQCSALRFMGSSDLQPWTRIKAMNRRMRKLLIFKAGIQRFMERENHSPLV
jgi:hypothetical protein